MLVLHQAVKIEDGQYIKGFVSFLNGMYYMTAEDNPNIGVPVRAETIEPIELVLYPQRAESLKYKIPFIKATISKKLESNVIIHRLLHWCSGNNGAFRH